MVSKENAITILLLVFIAIIASFILQVIILSDMYNKHIKYAGYESDSNFISIMDYNYLYKEYLYLFKEYINNYSFEKIFYAEDEIKDYYFIIRQSTKIFMTLKGPYVVISDSGLNSRVCRIRFKSFIDYFRYMRYFNVCRDKILKFRTCKSNYVSPEFINEKMTSKDWNWKR